MFAVRPICVQDSIFKMSSESPGHTDVNLFLCKTKQSLTMKWNISQNLIDAYIQILDQKR